MGDITQGCTSYEQGGTAPPWSIGWLSNSNRTSMEQHTTDGTFSDFQEETAGDKCRMDQMKKLFVGMAPKSAYEADFRAVFAPFGTLIDIYVIRDRNGFSKGCAFVKYDSVSSASDAIEALHDKHIMPGGFRTLVVTIADDHRGPQTGTATGPSSRRDVGASGDDMLYCLRRPPSFTGIEGGCLSIHAGPKMIPSATPQARGGAAVYTPSVVAGGSSSFMTGIPYFICGSPPHGTYVYYPHVPSTSCQQGGVASSLGPGVLGTKPHHAFPAGSPPVSRNSRSDFDARGVHEDRFAGDVTMRRFGIGGPEDKGRRWAKQAVGPTGANLFVYYLPGSVTDVDLAAAFSPFGEVLSAKVYYDRDTGESKGFGFVSYTKLEEAEAAICNMNGFFIGQKRLKVVRKRGQQADRYLDSCDNSSGCVKDPPLAAGDGAGRVSGSGSCKSFDHGNLGGATGNPHHLAAGFQADLDFFIPEGLLGQSGTRPL